MGHNSTGLVCRERVEFMPMNTAYPHGLEGWPSGLRRWFAKPLNSLRENLRNPQLTAIYQRLRAARPHAFSALNDTVSGHSGGTHAFCG